jgi:hypothetical protein
MHGAFLRLQRIRALSMLRRNAGEGPVQQKLPEPIGLAVELIAGRGAWGSAGGDGQTLMDPCQAQGVDLKEVLAELRRPATAPLEPKK